MTSYLRNIVSDSLVSFIKILSGIVKSAIIIKIITNELGNASYGIWVVLISIVTISRSAGDLHLYGSLIRYQDIDSKEESIYSNILTLSIISGTIASSIVYFILESNLFIRLLPMSFQNSSSLLLITSMLILSNVVLTVNFAFYRSKGLVKISEIGKILQSMIEAVGIYSLFTLGYNLESGLLLLLVVSLIFNLVITVFVLKNYLVPLPDFNGMTKYLKYSVPMVPKQMSNSLLLNADKYIILYYLTPSAVGIYAVVYSVSKLIENITNVLNQSLYPNITAAWKEGEKATINEIYNSIVNYHTVIGIPAVVGMWYLSYPILSLFSTADIATQGKSILPIISISFFIRGLQNPFEYILTSAEKTNLISLFVILSTISNIILNVFLIPKYGLYGAGCSTVISSAILTILVLYASSQHIDVPIPMRLLIVSIFSSIFMSLILFLTDIIGNSSLGLVLNILLGVSVYSLLISAIYIYDRYL